MKKSIIKLSALLLVCYAILGCGKEDNPTSKLGSIYGTVTDFVTGDPVSNANVRLNPIGETTLTGSDGLFQFADVPDGNYSLSLSKNGYVDLDDDYVIEMKNGKSVRRDVQLSPAFESFKITVNGVETDTLDFGVDPNLNRIYYSIINDGTIDINVTIGQSGNWITREMSSAHIASNKGCTTYVRIDREDLIAGTNIGYISVSSGTISKTMVVNAVGLSVPVVTIPTLSNNSPYEASSRVISDGGWSIVDKGFEYYVYWNGWGYETYSISCGSGNANFQGQIPTGAYTVNKVRAYASNGVHTGYSYWVYTNK